METFAAHFVIMQGKLPHCVPFKEGEFKGYMFTNTTQHTLFAVLFVA